MNNDFNPRFEYLSQVHFDELDPMQMLHNSRFAAHVERAVGAWYLANGGKWELDPDANPDQFHVVRDIHIEFLNPVVGPGTVRIELWVEHLGKTSCEYGFLVSSADGSIPYARGERTIVKVDRQSMRPSPWTERFRTVHGNLLKNLPAYA